MVEEFNKEKMERYDVSGGGTQTRKQISRGTNESEIGITESEECRDLRRNLTDLTSQVQMMSDSLAACNQMSKYRPLRKKYDVAVRKKTQQTPQTSSQTVLPVEKTTQERASSAEEREVIVSYMLKKHKKSKRQQTVYEPPEILTKPDLKNLSESGFDRNTQGLSSNADDFQKPFKRSSDMQKQKIEKIELTVYLIQSELKRLMLLVPAASLLIVSLSDMIFRYKERAKCSRRLSSSLPWILIRIRELIKYVADKRGRTDGPTTTDGSHKLYSTFDSDRVPKKNKKHQVQQKEPLWEIGKSEVIEAAAAAAAEARPGVQIHLQVKPEKQKKRFFDKAGLRPLGSEYLNFPVVHLNEPAHVPVVHVIKPHPKPEVFGVKKQEVIFLKTFSFSVGEVLLFPAQSLISLLLSCPTSRTLICQRIVYLKPKQTYEELVLKQSENLLTVFTIQTKAILSEKNSYRSNDRKYFYSNEFLADAPDIVKELMREAEEERMEIQKVEKQIKQLKDVVFEVHKNQIELSQVLLDKGIYSQPLIKLTDPNMLEEENKILKNLEEIEKSFPDNLNTSLESLQNTVRELTDKCSLKNKMIKTITDGLLQSNIPKDCWDDIMSENFDDERPIGEFDSEKVVELIQTLSLFFANGEKASRLEPPPSSRTEEHPAEEEPIMKGNMGANVEEDLKNRSLHDENVTTSNFDGFVDCQSPKKLLALPATNVPESINASVRKLENQISLLNVEKERLWHEVRELKSLLKNSRTELNEKRMFRSNSNEQLLDSIRTPRKTINLTIHVASQKTSPKNDGYLRISNLDEAYSESDASGTSKNSPVVYLTGTNTNKTDQEGSEDGKVAPLGTRAKFHLKSSRRTSQNDLNRLDDLYSNVSKKKEFLTGDISNQGALQRIMVANPNPSGHIFRLLRPKVSPPLLPDACQAGPSGKRTEHILKRPSVMELVEGQSLEKHAFMANERALQPILENDNTDSNSPGCSSGTVTHAIQQLKTRVRSINKEITMLKLRNDRIDKLLDKLVEDCSENSKSIEDLKNNLNDFNRQLG